MVEPTQAQLDVLDSFERTAYNLADFWNKHMRWQAALYNSTVMMGVTWLTVARRVHISGVENATALDWTRGVMIVANHRTFYDYFGIMSELVRKVPEYQPDRIMFPVRSAFFYERPLGVFLNLAMSGMAMFPPIMRERSKKVWNDYALARCVDELEHNACVVGVHPEGRRHPDIPMFEVRGGKTGVAHVALEAEHCQVLPVFFTGVTNDLLEEFRRNWLEPDRYPVFLAFGPEVDLQDLRRADNTEATEQQAVDRFMMAISAMAARCRELAGESVREVAEA